MASAPILLALSLLASPNRPLLENLTATDSGTRERAAYALAHTFDPSSVTETTAVEGLLLHAREQRQAAEGLFSRRWPEGRFPEALVEIAFPKRLQNSFAISERSLFVEEDIPAQRPIPSSARQVYVPLRGVARMRGWDPVALLPEKEAFAIIERTPGAGPQVLDRWRHRGDREWLRDEEMSSGRWDVAKLKLVSRPKNRPPCVEECLTDLLYWSWLGMDMKPALEIRTPPTTELDWWLEIQLRLIRAAGGDDDALSSLLSDLPDLRLPSARNLLLYRLTTLPPGLEVRPEVRPVVVKMASDPDGAVRYQALMLLAIRPELEGIAGAEEAFLQALDERNLDARVRAACELWDLAPLSADSAQRVKAALEKETDPVIQTVLRNTLARTR